MVRKLCATLARPRGPTRMAPRANDTNVACLILKYVGLALAGAAILAAPAQAEWRRATSRHFIVYSQGSPGEIKQAVTDLERYDQLLRLMSISKPDEDSAPLTVFMVANADLVGDVINQHEAAGFYVVGPLGPIAVAPRITSYGHQTDFTSQVILFHEYAHHYMLQNYTAAYPAWFVEGYAELLGQTTFDSDGSARVGNVAGYRLDSIRGGNEIPIADLLGTEPDLKKKFDIFAFYGEAWLLTHYLVFNDTRSPQLRRYLGLVSNGVKMRDAATQAFGDISKLTAEFNAYRNAPSLPGLRISQKNAPAIDDIRIGTLSGTEQALVWDRMLYMHILLKRQTAPVLADLLKRVAIAPNDPDTLTLLWRVQLADKDSAAADKTVDTLLASQPKNADALLGKGLIAMQKLEDAKDYAATRWAAARRYVIEANEARVGDPETLFAYYQSFVRAHLPLTQTAKLGLMRAFELQPQSPRIRLTLATSLIGERRYSEARIVLKPAAYSAHDVGSATSARQMLDLIGTLKDGDPTPLSLPEIDKLNVEDKSDKN